MTDRAGSSVRDVTDWLLDSDPAIRWQVLRDLTDAPVHEVAAERALVTEKGWGAQLLAVRDPDGQWAHGTLFPNSSDLVDQREQATASAEAADGTATADAADAAGAPSAQEAFEGPPPGWDEQPQPWTTTANVLSLLMRFGADPEHPTMRETTDLVARNARWEEGGQPFFDGEVEACLNGLTVSLGSYLGQDVTPVIERLVADQLPDGGWNCFAQYAPMTHSSFHSTLRVLEGLLTAEQVADAPDSASEVRRARERGEAYLLERNLLRRKATSELADERFLRLAFPVWWHYDVLRALEYFWRRGGEPDPRLGEAVEILRGKRQDDGRWLLEHEYPGDTWFPLEDGVGQPSRWNTLRAERVLRWWDGRSPAAAATR